MGWYGVFLVPKLKLAFHLRGVSEDSLYSDFDSLERFFGKYDKLREDMKYVESITGESKSFSAKATAKMFNIIDELGRLPEISDNVFLLYFIQKRGFEIDYYAEDKIDLGKLENEGWKALE